MAAPALANRVQQIPAASKSKTLMAYRRGNCPKCKQPMLVSDTMPEAPCVVCHEQE